MTIILQFANLVITNRLLGAEGRGLFASASTWGLGFFTIFSLTINIIYLKNIADRKQEEIDLKNGFSTLSLILAVFSLISAILFYILFNNMFIRLPFILFMLNILIVPFQMLQALTISVFVSHNDYKRVNMVSLINWSISLVLILCTFSFIKFNALVLSWITLISWICAGFYFLTVSPFKFSMPALRKITHRQLWKDLGYLHINTIMNYIVFSLNILVIHKYLNNEITGYYFLASSIITYLFIIPGSIQSVLLGSLLEKNDQGKVRLTAKFYKLTLLLMLVIIPCIFLLSKQIVHILGGKSFSQSATYLVWLLPSAFFQVAGLIWSALWSIKGYYKILTKVSLIVVLISVMLNFILIRQIGINGALITTTITSFLSMMIHLILARNEFIKVGLSLREMLPALSDFYTLKEYVRNFKLAKNK